MQVITSIIIFIFMCLYAWVISFWFHELMHVKSQGIWVTGTAYIHKAGFTVSSDKVLDVNWYFLSGGFLSGLVHLVLGTLVWSYGVELWPFYVPIFTCGMVNFVYGFHEMLWGAKDRYYTYAVTTVCMILFWLIYWRYNV